MENGHANENGHGVTNGDANTVHMDYSTDFPSLPISVPNGVGSSKESIWNKPRPVLSKNSTLTFVLPPTERSSKVKSFAPNQQSEEHKRCAGIATATGCRIELSESKDGSLTVIIQGPRHKVDDARNQVVRGLQTQDKQSITIPKDHHRKLIGKEGSALKQLEQDTNCVITIPKRDNASEVIEIKGPAEGIRRAIAHIREISHKEASQAVEHIVCPRYLYPFVRGPNNETYDKLVKDYDVKINIPPSSANNEVINVSGPKEGVAYAAAFIRRIVADKEKNAKAITIQVPKVQHKYVIGQQRKGLHEILRSTGVSVEVPNEDEQSDSITLRGDPAKLGEALTLVYQRASSVITQKLECPNWLHKHLIGPKGESLNRLVANRDKVQIEFDKENGVVFFEGSPEEVKPAYTAIENEMNRLKKDMDIQRIKVRPDLHPHLIGVKGQNINKIKKDTDVQITIPDAKTNSDEIVIEGKKDGVSKAVKELSAIAKRLENEKSKDLIIDQTLHKLLIGKGGSEINQIKDKYPSINLSFPEANKKSDVIHIRGDKAEVDAVDKILAKKAKELKESNYQEVVYIWKEHRSHVIGRSGQNIRQIREDTHTRIELPDAESDDNAVTVTGKQADVKKAVAKLNEIQDNLVNTVTIEIEVPVKVQGRLLGGGRRLIQDIEKECGGVHIKFPAEKSNSTKVTIRGLEEGAKKAEQQLTALVKDKEQNWVEDAVSAKHEFHRFLIGKGGSKISKIKENHDVRIMFPRENDEDKETIHLLGKKEDVAKVKAELEAAIKQLNDIVDDEIEIPVEYHSHFLAKKAQELRRIQDNNGGVTVSFPRSAEGANPTTVKIKGSKQCVEAAKAQIEEVIDDLKNKVTLTVEIDRRHHGRLLAGQNMRQLQEKYQVSITFPPRESQNDNTVTISGRDTKATAAREELLAQVPIERSINVPIEIHPFIMGKQWKTVNGLMEDYKVHITLPKREAQTEEIVVKGVAEDVENALEAINAIVTEIVTLPLDIPSEYHQKLIGVGGSNINRLRGSHDVEIKVPKSAEGPVTITGRKEKANACVKEIENWIEELKSLFIQEISIDSAFHPRMIGARRVNLKKIEDKYGVTIDVAGRNDPDPTLVTVAGKSEDRVLDCIYYLKGEEEQWLDDHHSRTQYLPPARHAPAPAPKAANVVINNAPWQMDAADFPEMGAPSAPAQAVGGAWGGPRRW